VTEVYSYINRDTYFGRMFWAARTSQQDEDSPLGMGLTQLDALQDLLWQCERWPREEEAVEQAIGELEMGHA